MVFQLGLFTCTNRFKISNLIFKIMANFCFFAQVGKTMLQNLPNIATACKLTHRSTYQNVPHKILGKVANFGSCTYFHCIEIFLKKYQLFPPPLPDAGWTESILCFYPVEQRYWEHISNTIICKLAVTCSTPPDGYYRQVHVIRSSIMCVKHTRLVWINFVARNFSGKKLFRHWVVFPCLCFLYVLRLLSLDELNDLNSFNSCFWHDIVIYECFLNQKLIEKERI